MTILSKRCKSDNFESFLESNYPNIYALCETNLDDSIDSGSYSVRHSLHLIWKDSTTNIHGLAVHVEEQLPFRFDLSLENSVHSYLFLTGFTSLNVLLPFPLLITFFTFLHGFWCYISSNINEVLSINSSANVFAFEDFNLHYMDWL